MSMFPFTKEKLYSNGGGVAKEEHSMHYGCSSKEVALSYFSHPAYTGGDTYIGGAQQKTSKRSLSPDKYQQT